MKKLIYESIIIVFTAIMFVGCQKESLSTNENQSVNETVSSFVSKSLISTNPFDEVGEQTYEILDYLSDYNSEIIDDTQYCPIEFSNTGQKIYSTESKLFNRLNEFANQNDFQIISKDVFSQLYEKLSNVNANPQEALNGLVTENKISATARDILIDYNLQLMAVSTPSDYITVSLSTEKEINNNKSNLSNAESELLYSIVSGFKYTAYYMEDNNLEVIPMAAGLPCGAAIVAYQASFVGLCMATGPLGWVVGGIGFAAGIWGVADNC